MRQIDTDKLAKIAGHIGGSVETQSAKAVSLIDAMLKDAGLTWAEVLVAGVNASQPARASQQMAGFGDIFADMMKGFGTTAPQAPAPKPRPEFKSGKAIPSAIAGTVRIDDERGFRDRTMLVVTVTDGHVRQGPLAIFDEDAVKLIKSLSEGDRIMGQVRQPTQDRYSPTLGHVQRAVHA